MSPSKYVHEAVRICEEYVTNHLSKGHKLLKRAENSFECGHCPELDVSLVLKPDEASYYEFLIEVIRWITEIWHTDIKTKVFLLSSHSAMPRQKHIEAAYISWVP